MNPKKEYDMLKSQIADSRASYLKNSSNHMPQVKVSLKNGFSLIIINTVNCPIKFDMLLHEGVNGNN